MNNEQQAFFDHHTREGTPHELIERKKALQQGVLDGTVGYNHKPALKAISKLIEMTTSTPEQDTAQNFIEVAQRLRNSGDEKGASRILKSGGLTTEVLKPRRDATKLTEREHEADRQYRIKRDESISQIMVAKNISKSAATKIFDGKERTERNPLLPEDQPSPAGTMDSQLKQTVNRQYGLKADRPI